MSHSYGVGKDGGRFEKGEEEMEEVRKRREGSGLKVWGWEGACRGLGRARVMRRAQEGRRWRQAHHCPAVAEGDRHHARRRRLRVSNDLSEGAEGQPRSPGDPVDRAGSTREGLKGSRRPASAGTSLGWRELAAARLHALCEEAIRNLVTPLDEEVEEGVPVDDGGEGQAAVLRGLARVEANVPGDGRSLGQSGLQWEAEAAPLTGGLKADSLICFHLIASAGRTSSVARFCGDEQS